MAHERSSRPALQAASGEPVATADQLWRAAISLAILAVIGAVLIMAWGSQRLATVLKTRDNMTICCAAVTS